MLLRRNFFFARFSAGFFAAIPLVLLEGCGGPEISNSSHSAGFQLEEIKEIKLVVNGLKYSYSNPKSSAPTQLCWALFAGPEGFPNDATKVVRKDCLPVNSGTLVFRINQMPQSPQGYVVSLFQDMNMNGKLDTRSLFGLQVPAEPFGFTQNPSLMGPPTFEKCKILPAENGQEFVIEMKTI